MKEDVEAEASASSERIESPRPAPVKGEITSNWLCQPSWPVTVYLAGDIEIAKQLCREECYRQGLCVTIIPCEYIYTGGQESGYKIGFVNYPRFSSSPESITARAKDLALLLIERTCQWSALIETPTETYWITRRPEEEK